jgi:hypothetical protein
VKRGAHSFRIRLAFTQFHIEVEARRERAARAIHNDGAHRVIALSGIERCAELRDDRLVDGIQLVRAIEREQGDALAMLAQDERRTHCCDPRRNHADFVCV